MSKKGLVDGLNITSAREFDQICEGCVLGKSHRLPFPKQSTTTYGKCELLFVDATEPMSHPTWTVMWYTLVVVEVSCQFGVGDLLPSKERMAESLINTVARLEHQSGKKVRMICSDNGSEFVNSTVEQICKAQGIIHQTTVPYTLEHNGIGERAIAIYFEMVRCMLHAAGVPLEYWGEVFMYAVHIRSMSYTSALNGMDGS